MTNTTVELEVFRNDGSHLTYCFDDSDYIDFFKTVENMQKCDDVVYISSVTCTEWFRDEINR